MALLIDTSGNGDTGSVVWRRQPDQGGTANKTGLEWEERWNVLNYRPPANTRALFDLLVMRPDLRPGQSHPEIPGAAVDTFDPRPLGTARDAYEVTVRYRAEQAETEDDPFSSRPKLSLTSESLEIPTFTNAKGRVVLNSAGDLLEGLTKTITLWVFGVEVNLPSAPGWILTYNEHGGAANSDQVSIRNLKIKPGYLKIRGASVDEDERGSTGPGGTRRVTPFYPTRFQLVYHPLTWRSQYLNRGLYQINKTLYPEDDKPEEERSHYGPCVDSRGEELREPAFLDKDGKQLPYPIKPEDVLIIDEWMIDRLPFRQLPIN